MVTTVSLGNLDSLVGLTFGWNALATASASLIDGSITTSSASTSEVVTYSGMTGTIGSAFIPMKSVTFAVASVSDANESLTIDAFVGKAIVGQMNFTVCGFNGAGIALAAMPLDSFIMQSGDLAGLAGSLFVLGLNSAGARNQSIAYDIGTTYTFFPNSGVYYATSADPVLQAGNGPKLLVGLSGNDTITAGPGKTVIYGGPGNDVLTAGKGTDFIFGGAGSDTIYGGAGNGTLTAGPGADTIHAGTGRSVMVGGSGADTFVFAPGHTGGLTTATCDSIQRFHAGTSDVINLSAFDAGLPAGGTGHLTFIGTAAFDGHAGEVRYDVTSTGVTLSCDLTGAGTADFMITLKNISTLGAADFVL
jgi:Ca2+-binding RTX toxin-like protein